MDRTIARVVAFALACLSVASTAGASGQADERVPRLVKVTGIVTGVESTTVALTFAFYSDQAAETPLWTETQQVAVDAAGRYAVSLGATRPEGLPLDLFAMGEARWLGTRVDGHAEQPRVLLVSVPYALKAVDADTIGGKPLSAFVLTGDKTGVGADGLTYVDAKVLATGLSGGGAPSGGAGAPNYIGVFSDATTLVSSVLYQAPGGSIGVNTTSPQAAFHAVSGAAPTAYLDVYSNSLGALPLVYRAARGTPAAPTAVQANDILGGLAVRGYGATGWSTGRGQAMYKAAENWTDTAQGTYLQLTTTPVGTGAWAERMRISPDGKVGIGTSAPAQALSVAGVVESTTGGFKFPDGTTQATASLPTVSSTDYLGIGPGVLSHNTGWWNTGIGLESLTAMVGGTQNTAAGFQTLSVNVSGSNNSAFGSRALGQASGSRNSAVGSTALELNLGSDNSGFGVGALRGSVLGPLAENTGSGNSAFGVGSLEYTSSGNDNAAFGYLSLLRNTTGTDNSAFGSRALTSNTAAANSAFGSGALQANTTAVNNSAFGFKSLTLNTTGTANSAFGTGSLRANTVGQANSAFGSGSLWANTDGSFNTAAGDSSLTLNTTGRRNAAVGASALYATTVGLDNVAVGYKAGYYNTAGSSNTFVGSQAGPPNGSGGLTNATAIGYMAAVGQSNSLVLGGTGANAVKVGIGLAAPTETLDVVGTVKATANASGAGLLVTQTGDGAGLSATSAAGDAVRAHGTNTGIYGESVNSVGILGWTWASTAPAAGVKGLAAGGAYGVYGQNQTAGGIAGYFDGKVQVNGPAAITGTLTVPMLLANCAQIGAQSFGTCSSDARLKSDVVPFGPVLGRVVQLQPVHFTWRTDRFPESHPGGTVNVGVIAQDVEKVFPELVSTDAQGFKQVNYGELPYLTLAAVKELKAENDALRLQVEERDGKKDEQIRTLTGQVEALTRAVAALLDRKQ